MGKDDPGSLGLFASVQPQHVAVHIHCVLKKEVRLFKSGRFVENEPHLFGGHGADGH